MKHSKGTQVKIGLINFLNTAPVFEIWKQTVGDQDWETVVGSPAFISKKIAANHLDIGFVSSYEYGIHPDRYKILSGLSISTNGSVSSAGSVFLFSHVPLDQLDQSLILLSSQSGTPAALARIILEEIHGIMPVFKIGDVCSGDVKEYKAVLASGDDALRLVAQSTYLYQFNLGDIWKRETGLPFVFDICVVRENFLLQHQETADEIHKELLRCKDEGINALKEICNIAAVRIPMPVSSCVKYLQAIEYDLGTQKQKALTIFFEFLIKRGEIEENALPLKIYSNLC